MDLFKHNPGGKVRGPAYRSPSGNRLRGRAGFTLLEILVALLIMAVVLVAVFRMNSQTVFMSGNARFQATAALLARNRLMALEASWRTEGGTDAALPDAPDAGTTSGDFGDHYPGYTWRVEIADVTAEALQDTADRLKAITITVGLGDDRQTYELQTHRFF